jgi:hypothetical protein
MNRNQHRLLNDDQIKDIITQMADDFRTDYKIIAFFISP